MNIKANDSEWMDSFLHDLHSHKRIPHGFQVSAVESHPTLHRRLWYCHEHSFLCEQPHRRNPDPMLMETECRSNCMHWRTSNRIPLKDKQYINNVPIECQSHALTYHDNIYGIDRGGLNLNQHLIGIFQNRHFDIVVELKNIQIAILIDLPSFHFPIFRWCSTVTAFIRLLLASRWLPSWIDRCWTHYTSYGIRLSTEWIQANQSSQHLPHFVCARFPTRMFY